MCRATNDIIIKVQELMELRRMAEELQSEIDALQEAVKSFMGNEETMIAGTFRSATRALPAAVWTPLRSNAICPTLLRSTRGRPRPGASR